VGTRIVDVMGIGALGLGAIVGPGLGAAFLDSAKHTHRSDARHLASPISMDLLSQRNPDGAAIGCKLHACLDPLERD
jgi:hypothetical protein